VTVGARAAAVNRAIVAVVRLAGPAAECRAVADREDRTVVALGSRASGADQARAPRVAVMAASTVAPAVASPIRCNALAETARQTIHALGRRIKEIISLSLMADPTILAGPITFTIGRRTTLNGITAIGMAIGVVRGGITRSVGIGAAVLAGVGDLPRE
jgi:hypothetical protein